MYGYCVAEEHLKVICKVISINDIWSITYAFL